MAPGHPRCFSPTPPAPASGPYATLKDMTMLEPIAPEESRLVFGSSHMYSVMVEIADPE